MDRVCLLLAPMILKSFLCQRRSSPASVAQGERPEKHNREVKSAGKTNLYKPWMRFIRCTSSAALRGAPAIMRCYLCVSKSWVGSL